MARITCRQPSTGKPISIQNNNVGTDWIIIAEAPDFSVPDPSGSGYPSSRDPGDGTRGIAAGEIFFLTPLVAKNNTAITDWIELRFKPEYGSNNDSFGRIVVPGGESVAIPIQGRSLIKRNFLNANGVTTFSSNGDILYVRAGNTSSFHVWASANEQASAEHVGVQP
jgi:hypothetical protein